MALTAGFQAGVMMPPAAQAFLPINALKLDRA
jgi:hypothetical protein